MNKEEQIEAVMEIQRGINIMEAGLGAIIEVAESDKDDQVLNFIKSIAVSSLKQCGLDYEKDV